MSGWMMPSRRGWLWYSGSRRQPRRPADEALDDVLGVQGVDAVAVHLHAPCVGVQAGVELLREAVGGDRLEQAVGSGALGERPEGDAVSRKHGEGLQLLGDARGVGAGLLPSTAVRLVEGAGVAGERDQLHPAAVELEDAVEVLDERGLTAAVLLPVDAGLGEHGVEGAAVAVGHVAADHDADGLRRHPARRCPTVVAGEGGDARRRERGPRNLTSPRGALEAAAGGSRAVGAGALLRRRACGAAARSLTAACGRRGPAFARRRRAGAADRRRGAGRRVHTSGHGAGAEPGGRGGRCIAFDGRHQEDGQEPEAGEDVEGGVATKVDAEPPPPSRWTHRLPLSGSSSRESEKQTSRLASIVKLRQGPRVRPTYSTCSSRVLCATRIRWAVSGIRQAVARRGTDRLNRSARISFHASRALASRRSRTLRLSIPSARSNAMPCNR